MKFLIHFNKMVNFAKRILTLNYLMYADDIVILSTSETGLQEKRDKFENIYAD